jgi:hypothetical protein
MIREQRAMLANRLPEKLGIPYSIAFVQMRRFLRLRYYAFLRCEAELRVLRRSQAASGLPYL